MPSWGPRWSQEGFKIDVKIVWFLRSLKRFLRRASKGPRQRADDRPRSPTLRSWGSPVSKRPPERSISEIQVQKGQPVSLSHAVVQAHGGGYIYIYIYYTCVDLSIKWTDRNVDAIRQGNRSLRGAVGYPQTSNRIELQVHVTGSSNRIK